MGRKDIRSLEKGRKDMGRKDMGSMAKGSRIW